MVAMFSSLTPEILLYIGKIRGLSSFLMKFLMKKDMI